MSDLFLKDEQYLAQTYRRFPLEIVRGKDALCWDENGKEYLDMGSGIAVNSFGYSNEKWKQAVIDQLEQLQHTSNLYYTRPATLLAEQLCERTGLKRVFFGNSGAEANECAIKAARAYAAETKGEECYRIITLNNSFHGRTITTLAATGQDVFHQKFLPLTDGFLYADANDYDAIVKLTQEFKIAAVMIELVQGEGGVVALDKDYVQKLASYLNEKDILLIVDEVQTGNGRTGTLYAFEQYNVLPDIVTTAKGLGGGLPIGACMLGEKVKDVLGAGSHGSTFGGNPVACAGALAILEMLDNECMKETAAKAEYLRSRFEGAKGIKSVSGLGLMMGLEVEKDAAKVIERCRELGVLVLSAKQKIRLLPPLNITFSQLEQASQAILQACAEE